MTVLWILGIVLLILLIFALLRVGVWAEYSESGFLVRVLLGPFRITVFPMKKKKDKAGKEKPKKEKKPKEKKPKPELTKEEKREKRGGMIELLKIVLRELKLVLSKMRRKLSVDQLTLYYTAAADDPFDAAMQYGKLTAGAYGILSILDDIFNIKKQDVRTNVDFNLEKPVVYVCLQLTIAIWEIVYVSGGMIFAVLGHFIRASRGKKKNKAAANTNSNDKQTAKS